MQQFYKDLNFPETTVNLWLHTKLLTEGISLKIVAPRKRKLGDYRYNSLSKTHQISINNNLPEELFTATLIHELAHKLTLDKYGNKVLPHGIEWKLEFQKLLNEAFQLNPSESVKKELKQHFLKPRASFKSTAENSKLNTVLPGLKNGDEFKIADVDKTFIYQKKLRKRHQCMDKSTGKLYSVSPFANVIKWN